MTSSQGFSFGGHSIAKLAKELETPFFLFSEESIEKEFQKFYASFVERYPKVRIDYCVKANREVAILKILRRLGAHVEIFAGWELELVKRAGFHPSQVVYDSPHKTPAEIEQALESGIHAFYADSCVDLENIEQAARSKDRVAQVALRIDLIPWSPTSLVNAWVKKFGVPYSEVLESFHFARRCCSHLEMVGLSTHLGSQRLSPQPFLKALEKLLPLGRQLESERFGISEISLGGGFPSPGLARYALLGMALLPLGINLTRKAKPLSTFGHQIAERFAELASRFQNPPILALQPGRSIVGEAAIAIARVAAVKRNWVFLDISANCLPESLFFAQREIFLADKANHLPKRGYNIAGRGLNTGDNLAFGVILPDPQVGDVAVIRDAGAYSLSRANRYTTLTPPAYLIHKDGTLVKIRREENIEDILAPMVL